MMTREDAPADGGFKGEADLIQAVFAPLAQATPAALALKDDAALLRVPAGQELVLTTDAIVAGVHFLDDSAPQDLGYKALAVNVSDLVAKGAEPLVYLLTIALPGTPDAAWLEGLKDGLAAAQADSGCLLAGGDTVRTPGPLTLSITAIGFVPQGTMVRRTAAQPGDRVYVSGAIGDAAAGLKLLQDKDAAPHLEDDALAHLVARYRRPRPWPALAPVLRGYARAAMDISDGLAGDFAKLCGASGCGGMLVADRVPLSAGARSLLDAGVMSIGELISGGDDYEVLATVAPESATDFEEAAAAAGRAVACIGECQSGNSVVVLGSDGRPIMFARAGYDHF